MLVETNRSSAAVFWPCVRRIYKGFDDCLTFVYFSLLFIQILKWSGSRICGLFTVFQSLEVSKALWACNSLLNTQSVSVEHQSLAMKFCSGILGRKSFIVIQNGVNCSCSVCLQHNSLFCFCEPINDQRQYEKREFYYGNFFLANSIAWRWHVSC